MVVLLYRAASRKNFPYFMQFDLQFPDALFTFVIP